MKSKKTFDWFLIILKGPASFCLRKIQGSSTYRKIVSFLYLNIEIKEANKEDLAEVHAWFNSGNVKAFQFRNPNVTEFVAKKGNRVIGFVQLVRHPEKDHLFSGYWLFSLTVSILYRSIGIGKELTQKVIEKAKEENAKEISLLVGENDQRAINFYHKLGFKKRIIPSLEEQLEKERSSLGRIRIIMNKVLDSESNL